MNQVVGVKIGNLTNLVNKAAVIERTLKINAEYLNQKKRRAPQGSQYGGHSHDHNKRRFNPTVGRNIAPQQPNQHGRGGQFLTCQTCGKMHSRRCRVRKLVCYRCGEPGHFAKDFKAPTNIPTNQNRQQGQQNTTPARVYALTPGDTTASNEAVTGTLLIASCKCTVLFDSGATHSCRPSSSYSSRENSSDENQQAPLKDPLHVPVGPIARARSKKIKEALNGLIKEIGGDSKMGHSKPGPEEDEGMSGFDVILAMDWLSMYHACVDCFCKEVVFKTPAGAKFKIQGNRRHNLPKLVSAMQVTRLLKQGCSGLLACVTKEALEAKLEEIPIVREFVNVFPEVLPGLPPDREIEFTIDLLPSTGPISKAPYRMVSLELRELKGQLQELLDIGFIRPSVSP
ncbi:uncharacterized protein LOC133881125 [Alnus glutinosa]|uniref:uncharacterized protein LOC133881125 n=1 Tax=Alnus glutinosa TaxID=3517 RepID=UPI002D79BC6D|nr:uncharacterized protein LOC133881125 [Alnus glutinosa]